MYQLKVSKGEYGGWCCTLDDWDLGVPHGYGNTIQKAIDDFIEFFWEMKDRDPKDFKYNWK